MKIPALLKTLSPVVETAEDGTIWFSLPSRLAAAVLPSVECWLIVFGKFDDKKELSLDERCLPVGRHAYGTVQGAQVFALRSLVRIENASCEEKE